MLKHSMIFRRTCCFLQCKNGRFVCRWNLRESLLVMSMIIKIIIKVFHYRLPNDFSARSGADVMTQKQFDKCQCNEKQSELQVLL